MRPHESEIDVLNVNRVNSMISVCLYRELAVWKFVSFEGVFGTLYAN